MEYRVQETSKFKVAAVYLHQTAGIYNLPEIIRCLRRSHKEVVLLAQHRFLHLIEALGHTIS